METETTNELILQLTPVGVVRSPITTPMLTAGESGLTLNERMDRIKEYHRRVKETVCRLEIFPRWVELLDGIEGFSHILVLYWPHLIDPARRSLKKVHPMGRSDLPLQGIFATCSPARPNPVLVSAVPLVGRKGTLLEVGGLEAVDGSPIIDIKPYSKAYLQVENLRVPAWMAQLHRELEDE
ncbi:tRNA (N6-threonylcarbamoyladenosine(37)-N6)-methyltransferase TrmO [Desulfococcus sp.]|uniref:tRNA (N6-threonylcarbamoyladenosine(37)-N6)-methyltransferase TrmO n=1 Tax=Desulfococcus sp. TaxID=2025834 RepID=UPI00359366CF